MWTDIFIALFTVFISLVFMYVAWRGSSTWLPIEVSACRVGFILGMCSTVSMAVAIYLIRSLIVK